MDFAPRKSTGPTRGVGGLPSLPNTDIDIDGAGAYIAGINRHHGASVEASDHRTMTWLNEQENIHSPSKPDNATDRFMFNSPKRVLVSGFFDSLDPGHIVFLETAASFGELHVVVGRDENATILGRDKTTFSEKSRVLRVRALRCVTSAAVALGTGRLDFKENIALIKPNIMCVASDSGSGDDKRQLCTDLGLTFLELPKTPASQFRAREPGDNTLTDLSMPPYRVCLSGGWLDQPWVSKYCAGPVITFQIHPNRRFNLRSGMATSTRERWKSIWHQKLFRKDKLESAKLLFGYENPPGTKYVAGSQDAIGLTHPGINRLFYEGKYWPESIDSIVDDETCDWLENSIHLVEMEERPAGYDPLLEQNLTPEGVKRLSEAGQACWEAIQERNIEKLGAALTKTHRSWAEILPLTTSDDIDAFLKSYTDRDGCFGALTSGCGGGYALVVSDRIVPESFKVVIKRTLAPSPQELTAANT